MATNQQTHNLIKLTIEDQILDIFLHYHLCPLCAARIIQEVHHDLLKSLAESQGTTPEELLYQASKH